LSRTRSNISSERAVAIVRSAEKRGVTLKLMGGLAIALHCHGPHSEHLRDYMDVDLFGLKRELQDIHALLHEMGFMPDLEYNRQFSANEQDRLKFNDQNSNESIDVFLDMFRMQHVIDFRDRLHLGGLTIPLTDLFLTKAQNTKLAPKDVTDIIALLEDHAVAHGEGEELLNVNYIAELCSDDWGLWKSVTDNLIKVRKLVDYDNYTSVRKPELLAKVASILDGIASRDKTFRWKLRSQVGEKLKWYMEVEE